MSVSNVYIDFISDRFSVILSIKTVAFLKINGIKNYRRVKEFPRIKNNKTFQRLLKRRD